MISRQKTIMDDMISVLERVSGYECEYVGESTSMRCVMLVTYQSEDGCCTDHHDCRSMVSDHRLYVAKRHCYRQIPSCQTIRSSGSLDDERHTTSKAGAARLMDNKYIILLS